MQYIIAEKIAGNTDNLQISNGVTASEGTDISLTDKLFCMSVPDSVIFGSSINFGQMRALSVKDRIPHLKSRIEFFLIDQVEPPDIVRVIVEAKKDGRIHEDYIFPRPFQLPVMTCVAVETLAQIAYSFERYGVGFRLVLSDIDLLFSEAISDNFRRKLSGFMLTEDPVKELAKINTYGDCMYSYFRNTMIHGYRATCVFLDHQQEGMIKEKEGYLILNPILFWNAFKELFRKVFEDLINNPDSKYRSQCKCYLENILK